MAFVCTIHYLNIVVTVYPSHYGELIKVYGPPITYWTGRYEAKHRIAKSFADSSKNVKNGFISGMAVVTFLSMPIAGKIALSVV